MVTNSPKRKRSRRSFEPREDNNTCSKYLSGKRTGPAPLKFPENVERDMLFGDREKENFLWCLLRSCTSLRQFIPSWTGYNIIIHGGLPVLQSCVRYLDCIDAPATEISTIYQVSYFTSLLNIAVYLIYNINVKML